MNKWQVSLLVLITGALCVSTANAQFGNIGGRPEDLLRRNDVRRELELTDDQIEQLRGDPEAGRERIREFFEGFRDLSREERAAKIREGLATAAEESQKRIDDVLLPHQVQRLKQLAVQYRLRGGTSQTLSNKAIAEELEITDEQKDSIRKRAEEAQKELNEKLAELRKEAQEKILQELTPRQRAAWKEMVGEPFEFQRQQFNFGRRNRGEGNEDGNRPDAE